MALRAPVYGPSEACARRRARSKTLTEPRRGTLPKEAEYQHAHDFNEERVRVPAQSPYHRERSARNVLGNTGFLASSRLDACSDSRLDCAGFRGSAKWAVRALFSFLAQRGAKVRPEPSSRSPWWWLREFQFHLV